MQRLVTAGLLPERAGQPVKVWAHISLADLMTLDGTRRCWRSGPPGPGAVGRAPRGGLGGRQRRRGLAGRRRRHRDGVRRGHGPVRDRRCEPGRPGRPGAPVRPARPAPPPRRGDDGTGSDGGRRPPPTPPRPGRPSSARSSARPWIWSRVRAGWRPSCAAGSSAPGWAGRACRWTSASPRPSRPESATPSSCATSTANGPESAASPPVACQVHHVKHKKNGGKTSVKDCVLLCFFHHQVVIHRWGWTLVLNPDGTTTAWNPDKTKILHSHGPPARPG